MQRTTDMESNSRCNLNAHLCPGLICKTYIQRVGVI